jgi:hypothetical protein
MPTIDTAMDEMFDQLYGSKYLSVSDLHGEEPRYRIGRVTIEELKEKDGATRKKFIVYFDEAAKGLVLNRTNATRLAEEHGKDRAGWIGRLVELYSEMTSLGKAGIRLRPIRATAAKRRDLDDDLNI